MRDVTFILSLILCVSSSFAQETKFIQRKAANGITEEYYVLKSDKKTKQGSYVKYDNAGPFSKIRILESGAYKGGEKDGLWTYFYMLNYYKGESPNLEVKTKGHYVNGKKNGVWVYYHMDTVSNPTQLTSFGNNREQQVVIDLNYASQKLKLVGSYLNDKRIGEWTSFDFEGNVEQKYNFSNQKLLADVTIKDTARLNKNRKPLFLGGESSLGIFLLEDLNSSVTIKDFQKDSVAVAVSFVISKGGSVSDCSIYQSNASKEVEKECIRLIQMTNLCWIPAMSAQGVQIASEYKFQFLFTFEKEPDSSVRRIRIKFSQFDSANSARNIF